MIVLISDLDGTLAKNKHRAHLKNKPDAYFKHIAFDAINKIGYNLYKSINADRYIILSTRPIYWLCEDETKINIWYITLRWLKHYNIPINDLMLRDPNIKYEKTQEDKLTRLANIVEYHKNDDIIYLENQEDIATEVKNRFFNVNVNLVSYVGATRL